MVPNPGLNLKLCMAERGNIHPSKTPAHCIVSETDTARDICRRISRQKDTTARGIYRPISCHTAIPRQHKRCIAISQDTSASPAKAQDLIRLAGVIADETLACDHSTAVID
jgi:hypothetical protein